jgi:hypothetical protein
LLNNAVVSSARSKKRDDRDHKDKVMSRKRRDSEKIEARERAGRDETVRR